MRRSSALPFEHYLHAQNCLLLIMYLLFCLVLPCQRLSLITTCLLEKDYHEGGNNCIRLEHEIHHER